MLAPVLVIYPAWILNRPSEKKSRPEAVFFMVADRSGREAGADAAGAGRVSSDHELGASRSSCSRFQRPPDTGSSSALINSDTPFWSWWCRLVGDFIEVETVLKPTTTLHKHAQFQIVLFGDRVCFAAALSVKTNGRVFQFNVFSDLFGNCSTRGRLKNSTAN
jgi:hypothetical protein